MADPYLVGSDAVGDERTYHNVPAGTGLERDVVLSWQTEVNKMIAAFGAPIGPADAEIIVDYLVANYGVAD